MTHEEIKELTLELFEEFEDVSIRLGRIGKFDHQAVFEVYTIIMDAVKVIEEYSANIKPLTGEDKKAVAVELMNDIIDIPWIPEFVEAALISWSIDLVVEVFNKLGGKSWLDMLFPSEDVQEV